MEDDVDFGVVLEEILQHVGQLIVLVLDHLFFLIGKLDLELAHQLQERAEATLHDEALLLALASLALRGTQVHEVDAGMDLLAVGQVEDEEGVGEGAVGLVVILQLLLVVNLFMLRCVGILRISQ